MFFGTRSLWAPASSLHGRSRTGPWTGPPDRPPDGPEWTGIGGANFCVVFVVGGGIVGKKRDHRILDPLFFSGKIRKNRKNSEK